MADFKSIDLEMWIDVGFINKEPVKVGYLKHDRGNVRFNYDALRSSSMTCITTLATALNLRLTMGLPSS
jgi:hypothetical protein